MAGVTFTKLMTSGVGQTKRSLGPNKLVGFFLNAVELQFSVDPSVRGAYTSLVAKQWSGPEAHWVKRGSPLGSPWLRVASTAGGPDDPDPNNVADLGASIAYFDSPGPSPGSARYANATRINVVQNFTGWIEGKSRATGKMEILCDPVVAWFSVVDIVNGNWDGSSGASSAWDFISLTTTGLGWHDATNQPVV
jgi:hypothetical protein